MTTPTPTCEHCGATNPDVVRGEVLCAACVEGGDT